MLNEQLEVSFIAATTVKDTWSNSARMDEEL